MRVFVIGLIFGAVAVCAGVYAYFAYGFAPVATAAEAMPFEKMLARKSLHARMGKEMPKSVPLQWDEANLTAGAQTYVRDCAVCHGVPGQDLTAVAKGMYPKPPKLMEGTGVTDDPVQESYWKIAGGIRMTGMPAFKESLSDTQLWQVSLLVANANNLPAAAKQILTSAGAGPNASTPGAPPAKIPKR
jgi:thiosulfate dehydrogenase